MFRMFHKLQNIYKICLKESVQPMPIATPQRLPLPLKKKVQEELQLLEKENIKNTNRVVHPNICRVKEK